MGGFLDVLGDWDPSLACVMGGAVTVNLITFSMILRRDAPLCRATWSLPTRKDLTSPLVLGSALFGMGWGLGSLCPGPGVVFLATGSAYAGVWTAGLMAGMKLHDSTASMSAAAPSGLGATATEASSGAGAAAQ